MTPAEFRAHRKTLGLTATELGERLGISRVSVEQKERGAVPIAERDRLAMEVLLRRAGLWPPAEIAIPDGQTPRERRRRA